MENKLKEILKNKKLLLLIGGVLLAIIAAVVFLFFFRKKEKTYTITFDTDGGSAIEQIVVKEGESVELPKEPTKEGFKFNGWLLDGQPFVPSTKIVKDIKLVAGWISEDAVTFKVTFNSDNGNPPIEIEVEENTAVKKPTDPQKDNATFKGWYLNDVEYDFAQPVTADITLVAQWEDEKKVGEKKEEKKEESEKSEQPATKGCDSGYTLSGDKCVKTESVRTSLSCPGTHKKLFNGKCYKGDWDLPANPACDDGWTFVTTQYCYNNTRTDRVIASCEAGYVLVREDDKCHEFITRLKPPIYDCPAGSQIYPNTAPDQCLSKTNTKEPFCPSRDGFIGKRSYAEDTVFCDYHKKADYKRKCFSSGVLIDNRCYTDPINQIHSCREGYTLSDNVCTKTLTVDPIYTCPTGYTLKGTTCYK